MNKDLIFREPIYNSDNKFLEFNYWGFNTDNGSNFSGPSIPTSKIKPKDSERYTGQKDKDNNLIYAGDIVLDTWTRNKYIIIDQTTHFKYLNEYGCKFNFAADDTSWDKVLGNIHENPELIFAVTLSAEGLSEEELSKLKQELRSFNIQNITEENKDN